MATTEPLAWTSAVLGEIWRGNREAREDLLAEVRDLSEAQLAFSPAAAGWSIGEILDHLCLAERSITRTVSRIFQQAAGRGLVRDQEAEPVSRPTIDEARLEAPATAPESALPLPDRPLERLLAGLEESRERLLEVSHRADGRAVGPVTAQHFQLGDLDFYQWLLVAGAHERKHLDQIRRIKTQPAFPPR